MSPMIHYTKAGLSTASLVALMAPALLTLTPDVRFFLLGLGMATVVGTLNFWIVQEEASEENWSPYLRRLSKNSASAGLAGLVIGSWTYSFLADAYPWLWLATATTAGYSGQQALTFSSRLLYGFLTRMFLGSSPEGEISEAPNANNEETEN